MLVGGVFISNGEKSKGGRKMAGKLRLKKNEKLDKLKQSPLYFNTTNSSNSSNTLTLDYFGGL
jgi:hypothetical protein